MALDEAYLDVTEAAGNWDGARKIAHAIKQKTWKELGLTCSECIDMSSRPDTVLSEESILYSWWMDWLSNKIRVIVINGREMDIFQE